MANITATSDDFDTNSNTFPNWVEVTSNTTGFLKYDATSAWDWWDGDDTTNYADYASADTNLVVVMGDGLLQDGGLRLDTMNAIQGDEAIGLTIGGTMESNTVITFTGTFYNDNNSYTDVKAELWNLTDGTLLADSGVIRVVQYTHVAYTPVDFTVKYGVMAADDGDVLQIRFRDYGSATGRDVYVDNFSVSAEPGYYASWNFNDDGPTGTILTNDTAQYDYTADQIYNASNAAPFTLAFNGRSGSTDYIIRNKGTGHETALYVKTLNTATNDFGVYIQKLDFTLDGANSSNTVTVSWSFDILGYNQNGNLDPNNWTVRVNTANTSQGLNVSDGWYTNYPVAQTFDFVADTTGETALNGTWTTVTGSLDIPVGSGGTVGGIQISTDGGGYTSSGGIFLDNIEVRITKSEPVLGPMFDAWALGYGLTNATTTGDPDGDLCNNLWEYAMGGNPTDGNDIGYIPEIQTGTDGGTNWLYYIVPQNHAAALAGLTYNLQTRPDLASGSWASGGYETTGTDTDGFGTGFDAVTNRVSTDAADAQFIKLTVGGL